MSLTEEQKAYHLRKMRTRVARLDVNKDGVISRKDYELMGEKLVKSGKLSGQQAQATRDGFLAVADTLKLTVGVECPVKDMAQQASDTLLAFSQEERDKRVINSHQLLFDVIDTNGDGHISEEEFAAYLEVVAPDVTEDEAKHSFTVIDADKNGEISCEEFYAAACEFFNGVDETDVGNYFMGKLLD